MPKHYLVDGHNALFRLLEDPPEEPDAARALLLRRATARLRTRRGAATGGDLAHVVFDSDAANPRAGTHGKDGPVSWSYARGSADEAIVALVRAHEGKAGGLPLVVVTDDRELRGRAAQLGAETVSVRAWFGSEPDEAPRDPPRASGPPMTAADFGLPDTVDLDADPEDL
jgi:hypothetical protein